MATNANVFNSRVTSEALEAKFRQVFPAQAGAELIQDLYASGVIQPVIDFSSVAEGSVLPQNLQTAWDFATGYNLVNNATTTIINNTGFWKVDLTWNVYSAVTSTMRLYITDGVSIKNVWAFTSANLVGNQYQYAGDESFVVFLRAGDSLVAVSPNTDSRIDVWYRQIADVNGNLVNPLGFTFQ